MFLNFSPNPAQVELRSVVRRMSAFRGILLQKSNVAGLKDLSENTKQRAIADSYDLNRVTEVACEFCVRP
jgi:hypothetical protein